MTAEPFLKPRLTGGRFERGAIPLEVLADFAVLSEMFVEVAKWRFYEGNPARKRVPRGFTDGISLRLAAVEKGSAIPVIELVIAGATLFPGTGAQPYLVEARQAIINAVQAAEQNKRITDYLPARLLGYFDRFGRNLAADEAIEFTAPSDRAPVRLTKETRHKLILASTVEEYTGEATVHGLVHESNQRNRTFELTLPGGATLTQIPFESPLYDIVLEAMRGFRDKTHVRVYGIGRFDRGNRLLAIEQVEHMTILDPLDIRVRIDELKLLKAGWLDGKGLPIPHAGLNWLADAFDSHYPDHLQLPYLFPTPEGGVLAEWALKPWSPSLDIDLVKRRGTWHALNLETDEETTRELDLANPADWKWLGEQVRAMGGGAE